MAVDFTETRHDGGFVVSEGNGTISREVVTLAALASPNGDYTLEAGTVLGKVTASGKYESFDQDASDGTEAAAAILYAGITVLEGVDEEAVVVIRDAEVNGGELIWPSDITAGEKTAAIAELAALGIIVR